MSTLVDALSLLKFIDRFSELTDVIVEKIPSGLNTDAFQGQIELAVYRQIVGLKAAVDFEAADSSGIAPPGWDTDHVIALRSAIEFVRKLVSERFGWRLDHDIEALDREVLLRHSRIRVLNESALSARIAWKVSIDEVYQEHFEQIGGWAGTVSAQNCVEEMTRPQRERCLTLESELQALECAPLISDRKATLSTHTIQEMHGVRVKLMTCRPFAEQAEVRQIIDDFNRTVASRPKVQDPAIKGTQVRLTDRQELILVAINELAKTNPGPWRGKLIAERAQLDYDSRVRDDLSDLKKLGYLRNDGAGYIRTNKSCPCP
jgi:hypothetical protein